MMMSREKEIAPPTRLVGRGDKKRGTTRLARGGGRRVDKKQQTHDAPSKEVNCFVPEGPGLAKGSVASSVVRSLCLAHLVLTSHHEGMLLDCAIACVPRYMGLRTQHRVTDKTRFLLQPRYTRSEYIAIIPQRTPAEQKKNKTAPKVARLP